MRDSITVELDGARDYPIFFGSDVLGDASLIAPYVGGQVFIVTNDVVANLYLDTLRESLPTGVRSDVFSMGEGERAKTIETYASILDALIEARHNRTTTVIALGGGVVGDVAGFVAATYQRGVGFIQIPTTLLAQVDSSVGGKTAVNHEGGKNLIGAFYQPRLVLADVATFRSLPEREYLAGVAEVIKYGVIADTEFFAWLEENVDALRERDETAVINAVRRSCEIKADFVRRDEREQGLRAHLNFGHTFGHAIEKLTDFDRWLHGEAVSIGMGMAMELSARLEQVPADATERVHSLLERAGLPTRADGLDTGAMIEAMGMDKKVVDGKTRFVVCEGIGSVRVIDEAPGDLVRASIASRVTL